MHRRLGEDLDKLESSINVGERIFSKYKVLDKAKRGGESLVFRVKHTEMDVERALKIIPYYTESGNTIANLLDQIRLWERFAKDNQNILQVQEISQDVISDVNVISFQMEYSHIGSLIDFIENDVYASQLSPVSFFGLAKGLLHGFLGPILYPLTQGVVATDTPYHSDIKPQNAVVFRDGRAFVPKIIDFGIAVAASSVAKGLSIPYAAPEILSGEEQRPKPASEVYSLGVTLYEFLYGRLPFILANRKRVRSEDETRAEYLLEITSNIIDFSRPRFTLDDKLGDGYNDILKTMLDPDPTKRGEMALRRINSTLDDLEAEARERHRSDHKTTYLGKSRYVWNPALHHFFLEREYFFIIRPKAYSNRSGADIEDFLRKQEIYAYSMHLVYGPYDYIVRFWSKKNLETVKKIAARTTDTVIEAIICTGDSRNLRGRMPRRNFQLSESQIKSLVRELVLSNDYSELKRLDFAIKKLDSDKRHIRAFTFIAFSNRVANQASSLFEALYNLFAIEKLGSLIKDGHIYQVEGTERESNTKIVIEVLVDKYSKVYDVVKSVISRCEDHNFDVDFKTFLEAVPNSIKLCDDGEFLPEVVYEL